MLIQLVMNFTGLDISPDIHPGREKKGERVREIERAMEVLGRVLSAGRLWKDAICR